MKDGTHAIAADPERDAVYVVDLHDNAVSSTIALSAGDEPGRVVEDAAGRVHVALRAGGALVTIDPVHGKILTRRAVCAAPRGVAYDGTSDVVWVACATGELVGLPAAGGAAVHSFFVERDLRDVVVGASGALSVSKFRSAEVLRVAGNGAVTRRDALPSPQTSFAAHVAWRTIAGPSGAVISVHQAESTTSVATQVQGGYGGGGCFGGGVGDSLPSSGGSSSGFLGALPVPPPDDLGDDSGAIFEGSDASPVDDAGNLVSSDGDAMLSSDAAVLVFPDAQPSGDDAGIAPTPIVIGGVEAGAANVDTPPLLGALPAQTPPACLPPGNGNDGGAEQPVGYFPGFGGVPCVPQGIVIDVLTALAADGTPLINAQFPGVLPVDVAISPSGRSLAAVAPGNAFTSGLSTVFAFSTCGTQEESTPVTGPGGTSLQPIAVAFDASDRLVVQTREPAELVVYAPGTTPVVIALSSTSREDTGQDVFHTQAGAMIACASCHPEGRDDGHVWLLDGDHRRTPSLAGTIAGTAPYHWPGDESDLDVLVNDVYTIRMGGALLPDDQRDALNGWVQLVPAPPPVSAASSASSRGEALFERADIGCASCHSGPKFTNNQTVDVGTGGMFQVPPLVGVAWRTPLMHDGCAATLADRFGACATATHGSTGSLSAGDISDLVAYLETL